MHLNNKILNKVSNVFEFQSVVEKQSEKSPLRNFGKILNRNNDV